MNYSDYYPAIIMIASAFALLVIGCNWAGWYAIHGGSKTKINKKLLSFYIPIIGLFILYGIRGGGTKEEEAADGHWLAPVSILYQVCLLASIAFATVYIFHQ